MSYLSTQLDGLLGMSKVSRQTKGGNTIQYDYTPVEIRDDGLEYGQIATLQLRIYRPVRINVKALEELEAPVEDVMFDVAREYGVLFGGLIDKVIEAAEDAVAGVLEVEQGNEAEARPD